MSFQRWVAVPSPKFIVKRTQAPELVRAWSTPLSLFPPSRPWIKSPGSTSESWHLLQRWLRRHEHPSEAPARGVGVPCGNSRLQPVRLWIQLSYSEATFSGA